MPKSPMSTFDQFIDSDTRQKVNGRRHINIGPQPMELLPNVKAAKQKGYVFTQNERLFAFLSCLFPFCRWNYSSLRFQYP